MVHILLSYPKNFLIIRSEGITVLHHELFHKLAEVGEFSPLNMFYLENSKMLYIDSRENSLFVLNKFQCSLLF